MPDVEQVKGKVSITSDTKGAKEASDALGTFKSALQNVGIVAAGIAIEHLTEKFISLSKEVLSSSVDTASKFEQWKMSFDVMLGSADKASKLMSDISTLAQKTPFELPQLVEGSKRLLAYGVESGKVVDTMRKLGDISAAVGTEKLPNLILAYGQVQAATKLTGMELRQFTEAGVPLLQALADHYNKMGTASVGASTTIQKGTKMSEEAITKLKNNIQETEARLKILQSEHVKSGIATDKHNLSIMNAQHTLDEYKSKLSGANKVVSSFGQAHKLTTEDIKNMISDNKVSAKDVEAVIGEMTQKGGKFYDMMNKQSQTFGGIVSNIRDQFTRLSLSILGFDMVEGSSTFGQIKDGTLFDKIHKGAQFFLDFLNTHQKDIERFARLLVNGFTSAVDSVSNAFRDNQKIINAVGEVLQMVSSVIVTSFTPVVKDLEKLWKNHQKELTLVAEVLGGALFVAILGTIAVVGKLIDVGIQLVDAYITISNKMQSIAVGIYNSFASMLNGIIDAINGFIKGASGNEIISKAVSVMYGVDLKNFSIPHVGTLGTNQIGDSVNNAFNSLGSGGKSGGTNQGISITNNNTFNTPFDPTNFAKQLGVQLSLAQG